MSNTHDVVSTHVSSAEATRPILRVESLSKIFDGLVAVDSVDLEVTRGEVLGLIGPNGAGKTTLFNMIAGSLRPSSGRILFEGEDVTGARPDMRSKRGIARTFQIPKPIGELTLRENVQLGWSFGRKARSDRPSVDELLERLGLARIADNLASSLTIGQRKRLELARALATDPTLMLLDEVMGGLSDIEGDEVLEVIAGLRDEGMTIVLIEHHMQAVMSISANIVVLNNGAIISSGTPNEVANDPAVIDAYLGSSGETNA